ncbi:MAG: hypothetical protein ACM3N0_10890 [Chloroflexota bacterium]
MNESEKAGGRGNPVSPESKEFLVAMFSGLREDLDEREPSAVEQRAIFDALLDGLDRGTFSEAEKLRAYVAELAKSTDEANEYERLALEHRALRELVDALARQA